MSRNTIKILLIEDNEVDARLIREYLLDASRKENGVSSAMFDLTWKNSLSSGLEFLTQEDVDAVLLDLNLPDSFGLETFSKIHKKKAKIPILILTGLSDRELAMKAVREGAGDYLLKGEVDGILLSRSISYAIERKKSEEELRLAQNNLEKKVHERTIELKERYDEIEQLVYAISHDLILPLVTIKGFLGYLKKDVASGSRQRIEIDIGLMGDAVERMEALLVRALDISSIGKLSNTRERVLYGELVKEALSLAADKIRSSGAKITVADDFPMVSVDRPRIVDVLVNLIENCIRYASNNGPLQIEIGYQANGGETVFFVKDDGLGIDPIMQKNIFRLFYRGSEAEDSHAGLALSRRIIEVHGGRIWIESVVNKGCAVCFTIP
ncbi:MAG: ATP-binding protein [Methanothrix sp.]|nr:ATP-binding protein [Methanothrix sp.]